MAPPGFYCHLSQKIGVAFLRLYVYYIMILREGVAGPPNIILHTELQLKSLKKILIA